MADKKGAGDDRPNETSTENDGTTEREKLKELCDYFEAPSEEELALGRISDEIRAAEENVSSSDEFDAELEAEYDQLNEILDLPEDTYSLTKIHPILPSCVKYGVLSGRSHFKMSKFSPLSRGLQGPACAIAGFATNAVLKSRCWNELVIDQIIEDGDTYYCESYEGIETDDRRTLSVRDLRKQMVVQNTHKVYLGVDHAAYAGRFRSQDLKEMHLVKALELFFNRYDAGLLISDDLNIAIWKDARLFNIFDGQPRDENCIPVSSGTEGFAKLILVRDLTGLIFIILDRSGVKDEPFVLFPIHITGTHKLPVHPEDPEEPFKSVGQPMRRPSGYKIQEKFRALIQGTHHLMHPQIPNELRGRSHLVIAVAALVYSRLINANKWTSVMIDLIFNQAHVYMIDLVRALNKKLDDNLELKIDDLMGDVILGVYSAKINVIANVVPGQRKKGKATLETGLREFFQQYQSGILEIRKTFYPIWQEDNKFYFLDPFACDDEGFRVNPNDPEEAARYKTAKPCVTMNGSVNQLVETILENTGNKEKDPFVIHGIRVLYVRTGTLSGGSTDEVIYREKKTNQRPAAPKQDEIGEPSHDDCKVEIDMTPKPRLDAERTKDQGTQFPKMMPNVEDFMMGPDEPTSFVVKQPNEPEKAATNDQASISVEDEERSTSEISSETLTSTVESSSVDDSLKPELQYIVGYRVVHPHRLLLQGTKNCLAEEFEERARGRQGLAIALTAMAYSKIKTPATWRNIDVNQIVDVGNKAHADTIQWIRRGSPAKSEAKAEEEEGDEEEEEESEEEDDEEEEEESSEAEEDDEVKDKGYVRSTPSHIDVAMLPEVMKLGENEVRIKKKLGCVEGDANPLANLGEALEHYLDLYDELVVENKQLMYGVWKNDGKYYLFNPYGSDEEGRRLRGYPAAVIVSDTINELTDIFYEILEYNDSKFAFHFIGIESIQPGNKYVAPKPITIPEGDKAVRYKTLFLPITDEDLFVPEPEVELKSSEQDENKKKKRNEDEDEDEEDEEEDEEDEEEEEEDEESSADESVSKQPSEVEKPIVDPLLIVEEQDQPDAPEELNFYLLAGDVIIDETDEQDQEEEDESLIYEKLKYNHPPPYVLPPKKVLCLLLEAKRASRSAHSLVSRFSIDSLLSVKKVSGLPPTAQEDQAIVTAVSVTDGEKVSKLIKLPPNKYLVSRILPTRFTPIRAINDKFVGDETVDKREEEQCRRNKCQTVKETPRMEDDPEFPGSVRIKPVIIPLGPPIKTPTPIKKSRKCITTKKRRCRLNKIDEDDPILKKITCDAENLLLDMMFPGSNMETQKENNTEPKKDRNIAETEEPEALVRMKDPKDRSKSHTVVEECEFKRTDEEIDVLNANMCLEDRNLVEECHFKQCYFTALLCILAKIRLAVNDFRGSTLDELILGGNKIYRRTGKLRYKYRRWFYNIEVRDARYNAILQQIVYADPENCSDDELSRTLLTYLDKNQSGILVFSSASYAFWFHKNKYYLFDPYACDENGHANDDGFGCLMRFSDLDSMVNRIKENNGDATEKPYRVHAIAISHMRPIKRRKRKLKRKPSALKGLSKPELALPKPNSDPEPVLSLAELTEWLTEPRKKETVFDFTIPGFSSVPYFNASTLEVIVLENDIKTPVRPELKPGMRMPDISNAEDRKKFDNLIRVRPYDRHFKTRMACLQPLDLCIMAWACIHDPTLWGSRTIKGLYEASQDFMHDCILATDDTTIKDMADGILLEFTIANYNFHAVFVPLHYGTLYAEKGWNLAMSLKKILSTPIYTGAIIICARAHIGVMKRNDNYYAWWGVLRTKHLKVITSEELEDLLKLIVREINMSQETTFMIRVVTISYARKTAPNCEDVEGLHETVVPATSLAQIHRKMQPSYDIEAIFRKTVPDKIPIFVRGTVAIRDRDTVKEPRVKRCYFVALLAVMVKRDIVQSTVAGTIDRIIEVAENLYKEFDEPQFHTEHIIKNVTIMNRMFDFRDCATPLVAFENSPTTNSREHFLRMKKSLKRHFKWHSDGIIHFTNCCYGFWYSKSTNSYYYLDPYQCDPEGKRIDSGGNSCLCIFPSLCSMTRHMFKNRFEDTTGFFIHRLHVESINVSPYDKLQEDPMWVYLDVHWSFSHAPHVTKCKRRRKQTSNVGEKPSWNHYAIEVPNLIYSVWGTLGCYDPRFGRRAGRNQAAICVAVCAMQFLCHPSRWGPAILDSAVICGDCYHTESLKSAARNGCSYSNRFNLQSTFKVHPHVWNIEFRENMCGMLYGGRGRMTLAAILKLAFDEAPNVIIECNGAVFSVLAAEDGYYAADPRWTGPPLFSRNHGALYVLRCRNINALIYAVTKMLNTNLHLEFHITPVMLTFHRETRQGSAKTSNPRKKILTGSVNSCPARSGWPSNDIPGSMTTPDEDTYSKYRDNLKLGVARGDELEDPPVRSPEPELDSISMANTMVSTLWHLNGGHPRPRKNSRKPVEAIDNSCTLLPDIVNNNKSSRSHTRSRGYPRLVNLVEDDDELATTSFHIPTVMENDATNIRDESPDKLFCGGKRSFINDTSRKTFKRITEQLGSRFYKIYEHKAANKVVSEKKSEPTDDTDANETT